jgi:hypothetical protein
MDNSSILWQVGGSRRRTGKHFSTQIWFVAANHCRAFNRRSLGYGNRRCGPGKQSVATKLTQVSMRDVDSWRPTWYRTRSRVNGQATNVLHVYRRLYKRLCREERIRSSHVEARSNTSTVALPVVRGDEKGSLESDTVKHSRESHGTGALELLRWRGPSSNCKRETRPIVRESAPCQQTCNYVTEIKICS